MAGARLRRALGRPDPPRSTPGAVPCCRARTGAVGPKPPSADRGTEGIGWWIRFQNSCQQIDAVELSVVHIHPPSGAGFELDLSPPDLVPQIGISCRAMRTAAAAAIGPLRKRDVELGIVPAVEPHRRESLPAIRIGQDGISPLQFLLGQVTIHTN